RNAAPRPNLRSVWHESSVRMIVLMAALVAIVGLAFLIRLRVVDSTIDAMRWVAHTHEVEAIAFELRAALDEMEAAAFAAQFDPLSETASHRYGAARARYAPLLDRLRTMTRDNPEQQERVGMLRARIDGRVTSFDEALLERAQGRDSQAGKGLLAAVTRYPIDDVLDAIVDVEGHLVADREARAERQTRIGNWVVGAVSVIQLLLLAAIIWASETQLRRRLWAEAEASQAVERARLIVATVREPIAVLTPDLSIMTCNQAFTDQYALEQGQRLGDDAAWSDQSLLQRLRDVALRRREIWDYELAQKADGDLDRNVLVNARPMALPDVPEAVILLTVSDITARKRFEAEILELNRQLRGKIEQISESNRELEAFSYSVSHDLRAPLRHIAGFAEKLRAHLGAGVDERTLHYSDVVVDSARRMSSLIEDLLTYSRLGRHAMRLKSVDMQAMVEEVRFALTSMLEDRRITWRIAPLPVVVGDENMLRLVWQNLIDNAIKYSASREEAIIEIGTDEATPLEWSFWIRDNGVGFDMGYADKLFGVFQRLHKASQFPGTGIGLASVRRIVGRHGGKVWAEASPDRGATFRFTLPRTQNRE
ncbi:MAG TPA: ATP-binding protein, partial [Rhodanobacteraceae bacterium]|nr:ATP-binding protein [Rhodanobacteraceae bacterium]